MKLANATDGYATMMDGFKLEKPFAVASVFAKRKLIVFLIPTLIFHFNRADLTPHLIAKMSWTLVCIQSMYKIIVISRTESKNFYRSSVIMTGSR